MANLPATIVCPECGTWMRLDANHTGNMLLAGLFFGTILAAWFWPAALILLPVYLVLSTSGTEKFSVTVLEKERANIWTINRETGAMERLRGDHKAPENADQKRAMIGQRFNRMTPIAHTVIRDTEKRRRTDTLSPVSGGSFVSSEIGGNLPTGLPH